LFAESVNGVVWAMMPTGCVRGYAYEGGIYGPDAPFVSWLGDQVVDLEYATDHPDTKYGRKAFQPMD
jgi:hypothetical protein